MRQAFTLIELLVTIVIVGILLAILLPAIAKAKSAANATICQSNLRSFGQAINLYLNERNTIPDTDQVYIMIGDNKRELVDYLAPFWDVPEPSLEYKVKPWCCPSDIRAWPAQTGGTYAYYPAILRTVWCVPPANRNLRSLVFNRLDVPLLWDGEKLHGFGWNIVTTDGAVRQSDQPINFSPY